MGFFQTKDPKTGEPRLGAGVYLIVCALMIGGVVLWNMRQHAHDPGFAGPVQTSNAPSNPTDVQSVASAAISHQEAANISTPTDIGVKTKSARGVELSDNNEDITKASAKETEPDNLDTIQNTVELLRDNEVKAEQEKAQAVAQAKAQAQAEGNAKIAELQKKPVSSSSQGQTVAHNGTTGAQAQASHETVNASAQALTVYDSAQDNNTSSTVQKVAIPTGFDTNNFLPRGTLFPVYILTTVQTVNQEDIVEMGVAENVIFQHKIQLPFGTRLLGTAAASNFEDRVMINVDTILYPDGKELGISAFLKDASDLSSGVRGYYIPQPFAVQITPYVSEFIDLWTQAAAQRFSGINQVNSSGTSGSGQVFQGALQQTSDLIQQQAEKIQQRLDKRYPEKVVVPIGTKAYASLRTPLDLTRARIAGSLYNRQRALPGFENNPVDPNGAVERTANYGVTPVTATIPQAQLAPTTQASSNAANNVSAAQEAQAYSSALKQLQTIQSQINSSRPSATTQSTPSATNSSINWPKGDIE